MSLLLVLYDMILVAYCGVSELHEQVGYSCLSNLLVLQSELCCGEWMWVAAFHAFLSLSLSL